MEEDGKEMKFNGNTIKRTFESLYLLSSSELRDIGNELQVKIEIKEQNRQTLIGRVLFLQDKLNKI